jgi:pyruvate/2-oxoglutarate dehydrogenase complex dihydrolipoamide acyltransferase (E2) component
LHPSSNFRDVLRYINEGGKPATDEKKASKKPKKAEDGKEASRTTSAGSGAPTPTGVRRRRRGEPHKDVPISGMRKVIASRLTESKVRLGDTQS